MALTTSTITGRVPLPTDEVLQYAELTFALSGLDTQGADVLPGGIIKRVTLVNSELPAGFKLWRNTSGLRGTHYRVLARWTVKDRDGVRDQYADLGIVQVGASASYTLASLINSSVPAAIGTFWSSITQAQYDEAIGALDATIAAKDAALGSAGDASNAAALSQAWAESATAPGSPGTKSSKSWAADAAAAALGLPIIPSPTLAAGDLLYATGPGALVRLPKGTDGQVLMMDPGAPAWADLYVKASLILTVGISGDYPTVGAALVAASEYAVRQYKPEGVAVEVKLLSGFVLSEQVFVNNQNLGFVTLTSVDPVVYIDPAALTQFLVSEENSKPAFGGVHGAVLPNIGVQFEFMAGGTQANHGLEVYWRSRCRLLPGSGFRKSPGRGMSAIYGSELLCYPARMTSSGVADNPLTNRGVDCSQAATRGLYVAFSSRALLTRSNFDNCAAVSGESVYIIWGSYADLYQSYIRYSLGTAVEVRDMSICNARECEVNDAAVIGFHAYHQAHINARWLNTVGSNGASRCQLGILANHGSTVEAPYLPMLNCTVAGVSASRNSRVSAENSDASGSVIGYLAALGATITAGDSKANNCSDAGYRAASAALISASAGSANGCSRGFEVLSGGKIGAQGASATGCTQRAVSALEGGEVNVMLATLTGAGTEGVTARNGARVNANSANARKGGVDASGDFTVQSGGIINASSGTGGTSVTINTISASGIIFK